MDIKLKVVLSSIGSVISSTLIYIVLHEGGHSLVAVICGANITTFSILGAHMSYDGGIFNSFTLALLDVAGMLFPVLVSIIYMIFYQGGLTSILYRIFSFLFVLIPISSILAWVFVPIFYLFGKEPINDDVTRFLNNTGINPVVIVVAATITLTCCIFIAWNKKIIRNYWSTLRSVR